MTRWPDDPIGSADTLELTELPMLPAQMLLN